MKFKSKELKLIVDNIKGPKSVYLGLLAAILAAGISAFLPYISGRLVDIALKSGVALRLIFCWLAIWLILAIIQDLLQLFSARKGYEMATDWANNLEAEFIYHLLTLPMKFHKDKKTGKILRQIDRGLEEVSNVIENTIFSFLPAMLSLIIAFVILTLVEWRLSVILLIASICYVIVTLIYTKEITQRQKQMNQAWETAYGKLYDSISNVQTIKATANELWEKKKFEQSFNRAGTIFKNWRAIWQKMSFRQGLIFTISFILVFGLGVIMLRDGTLTAGKLVMFVGYIGLLTSPLSRLSSQYRLVKTAIVSFRRAIRIYETPAEVDSGSVLELENFQGEVIFDKVSFGYQRNKIIVKEISFEVKAGEKVALVGESGVGKTTIVDLLGKYYLPNSGRILIDGVNVRDIKLGFLRSRLALVPQEVALFNDTIKNNIKYGRPGATDQEVLEAVKAANAYEFIEKFPKKLDQMVGERGIKLSTGQKQRVAIARAIIRDPKILILDEATSALDSVSEKLVQEALDKLIQGRTTFIIAHRLSTIRNADKIIVLEGGKIVEIGKHDELIKNPDGIYRNFWELQSAIQKVKS